VTFRFRHENNLESKLPTRNITDIQYWWNNNRNSNDYCSFFFWKNTCSKTH